MSYRKKHTVLGSFGFPFESNNQKGQTVHSALPKKSVFPKNFIRLGIFSSFARKGLSIFRKPPISCSSSCCVKYFQSSFLFRSFSLRIETHSIQPSGGKRYNFETCYLYNSCFVPINAINHAIFSFNTFSK